MVAQGGGEPYGIIAPMSPQLCISGVAALDLWIDALEYVNIL